MLAQAAPSGTHDGADKVERYQGLHRENDEKAEGNRSQTKARCAGAGPLVISAWWGFHAGVPILVALVSIALAA